MRNAARKDLGVFDFKDEDKIELISKELVGRFSRSRKKYPEEFRTPKADTSPLSKYQFLKAFSAGVRSEGKKMSGVSCIDTETSDCNPKSNDHGAHAVGTCDEEECVIKGASGFDEIRISSSISHTEDAHRNPHIVDSGHLFSPSVSSFGTSCWSENPLATGASSLEVPLSANGQIHCAVLERPSSNNQVDVMSDDGGSTTCSSDMREDQGSLEDLVADHYFSGGEMEKRNSEVTVNPDYLIYEDLYSTESLLCFSRSCVKLKGQNSYGRKGVFSFEWELSDVIGIESQWYERVETAQVKLCIKTDADMETDIRDGTSGTLELKCAVYHPHWFDIQEQIMSLDARYKSIWRDLLDIDSKEDAFVGRKQICPSKCYYPIFDKPFEDVIYPKGDPDAVSISKRDVELLKPETFINDTIIDFYIKYLKNKIKPENRNKFHFFNSFFFRKLADLDKNPSSASEGRAAFLRVRKWTRKVNLFEKDYVFIPVNFSLHWSLLVICHPGEVATFRDEEVDKSPKVPCILHMDSIKGSHKGLKNLIQSYLWEEWKERQPEPSENATSNFINLRFVPLELPQQENSFDCGLFLLHYAEMFLDEAPANFNPFKLSKLDNFLAPDWFQPVEASLKRAKIQNLIYDLLKDYSQYPSAARDEDCQLFPLMENNDEKDNGVAFLVDEQIAANTCNGFSSSSSNDQGIEIKLLETPAAAHFVRESGLVLKELLDPGTTAGTFPSGEFQSFDQMTSFNKLKAGMLPIEEDEETGEQFVFSPSGGSGYQQLAGYTVGNGCTDSYPVRTFELYDTCTNSEISKKQIEDDHDGYLSSGDFSCGSQSSSELVVDENIPAGESWCPNGQEIEKLRSISLNNNVCAAESPGSGCSELPDTHIVPDSQEMDRAADDDEEIKGKISSCQENLPASSDHLVENENQLCGNQKSSHDMNPSDSIEQTATKRAKITVELEDDKQFTRSLAKDCF